MRAVDEIFSRADSTGSFTPLTDALGSTIALVDASGNLSTQYTYDPFGNTTVSGVLSSNRSQYTGRENEGNGLYFYRARYYSPLLGRFVSEDPLGFNGGNTNVYGYVANSPTDFVDPSGQCPTCITAAIGAGLGAGIGAGVAYFTGGDVKQGAIDGAIAGGVSGLTLGLGGGCCRWAVWGRDSRRSCGWRNSKRGGRFSKARV